MIGALKLISPSGELLPGYEAINELFQSGPIISGPILLEDADAPKAYLNYILFDSDYIPYDMGFDKIDKDALETGSDVPHDYLSLQAVATKPGYIYIYLSNENNKIVDVYFDDLLITHTYSPIEAGADYYPFGLVIACPEAFWGRGDRLPRKIGATVTRALLRSRTRRRAIRPLN